MHILIILNSGLGSNIGPNCHLSCNVGGYSQLATVEQLLNGLTTYVPDTTALVYIDSIGTCTNRLTLSIPTSSTTTTTTIPSITTTTTIPVTTTTTLPSTTTTTIPITTTTTVGSTTTTTIPNTTTTTLASTTTTAAPAAVYIEVVNSGPAIQNIVIDGTQLNVIPDYPIATSRLTSRQQILSATVAITAAGPLANSPYIEMIGTDSVTQTLPIISSSPSDYLFYNVNFAGNGDAYINIKNASITTTTTTIPITTTTTSASTTTTTTFGLTAHTYRNKGGIGTTDSCIACSFGVSGYGSIYSYDSVLGLGSILYQTNIDGVLSSLFDTNSLSTYIIVFNGEDYAIATNMSGAITRFDRCLNCGSTTTTTLATTTTTTIATTTTTTAGTTTTTTLMTDYMYKYMPLSGIPTYVNYGIGKSTEVNVLGNSTITLPSTVSVFDYGATYHGVTTTMSGDYYVWLRVNGEQYGPYTYTVSADTGIGILDIDSGEFHVNSLLIDSFNTIQLSFLDKNGNDHSAIIGVLDSSDDVYVTNNPALTPSLWPAATTTTTTT